MTERAVLDRLADRLGLGRIDFVRRLLRVLLVAEPDYFAEDMEQIRGLNRGELIDPAEVPKGGPDASRLQGVRPGAGQRGRL